MAAETQVAVLPAQDDADVARFADVLGHDVGLPCFGEQD
jgi:hypothetical protein